MIRAALAPAACIGAMLLARAAHAEPSPADRALATELFDRGRALMTEGRASEACPKFEESQRLDPSPGTLLNLANCHEVEGKTATAWSEFNQALAVAEREGQADRVAFAESHIRALAPRLSRLVLVVPEELANVDLEVMRDGTPIARVVLGTAMPIDPGKHTIEVKALGFAAWSTTIEMEAAEKRELVIGPLVPTEEPPFGPLAIAPPIPPVRDEAPPARARSWVPLAVGGVGIVGIGIGTIFGALAIDRSARSDARCIPRCSEEGYALNQDAKSSADVSTVAFVAGAIALGTSIVLYLTSPR